MVIKICKSVTQFITGENRKTRIKFCGLKKALAFYFLYVSGSAIAFAVGIGTATWASSAGQ